jgi:hypothetical protein
MPSGIPVSSDAFFEILPITSPQGTNSQSFSNGIWKQ